MNKPLKTFRAKPLSITIWENRITNDDQENIVYSFVIERSYKDKNGSWMKTNSMRLNDLPKQALLSNKAFEFITLQDVSNTVFKREEEVSIENL